MFRRCCAKMAFAAAQQGEAGARGCQQAFPDSPQPRGEGGRRLSLHMLWVSPDTSGGRDKVPSWTVEASWAAPAVATSKQRKLYFLRAVAKTSSCAKPTAHTTSCCDLPSVSIPPHQAAGAPHCTASGSSFSPAPQPHAFPLCFT